MSRLQSSFAIVAIVAAIATGATLTARAWSDGAGSGDGGEGAITADAVCRSARAATDGGSGAALRVFFDDAHERLHRLAARLSDGDPRERAGAARLLESKQRVEAAVTAETSIRESLVALVAVTERAAALDDGSAPEPCEVS